MKKIQGIVLLVIVLIIGFSNIVYRIIKMNKEQKVVINYRKELIEFLNGINEGNISARHLEYLNSNSCEVQSIVGALGIAVSFIDPILGLQCNNYQIIINGVDEISRSLRIKLHDQAINAGLMMSNSLGKYIGSVDSDRKKMISYMKNPFTLLREGVRVIVGFPIFFLYWSGLINYSRYHKIKSNIIVKLIGFILGFLGFIDTMITIITGYKPSIEIIKQFFN